ncbi:hypothetical protein PanWU01x14_065320, partial [Parasponia andersonii]
LEYNKICTAKCEFATGMDNITQAQACKNQMNISFVFIFANKISFSFTTFLFFSPHFPSLQTERKSKFQKYKNQKRKKKKRVISERHDMGGLSIIARNERFGT